MVIKRVVQKRGHNSGRWDVEVVGKRLMLLGSGVEAVVYHNSNKVSNIGVVTKWIVSVEHDIEKSGLIQYLIKGNQLGNIHVPVVYQIKQISLADGNYSYIIEMEKLNNTIANVDLDQDQLHGLMSNVIACHWDPISHGVVTVEDRDRDQLAAVLWDMIHGYSLFDHGDQFRQLTQLVTDVQAISGCSWDMHSENWMVRHTSVGMQLVLVDPLIND